ncbi:Fic family protein [Mycolicibacterium obuense]|uniref:Fic family protein n=1 Tax=Mycolicibacterium obuense TaxID=1807 RepID=UPI001F35E5DD|nr:Fic family protein [Mycolicibacterium obuense]
MSLPPYIAKIDATIDADIAVQLEAAMSEISRLDSTHGPHLAALSTLLLRIESVASSKIERVEASLDDYARALHGGRGNSSAISMAAATTALNELIASVNRDVPVQMSAILRAHEALMRDDPTEGQHAGQLRTVQNWIGGSDHSPRDALYVPPPPDTVHAYMDDLMEFANRTDIPVLIQAAIAHAQFESIHPFTDGNGRIGRALINTIFRRRGATTRLVVPLASALVAHRERYFGALNTYRAGDLRPLIVTFANSSKTAAAESRITAERLTEIPAEWRNMVGPIRRHSAADKLLLLLPSMPIFSSDDVAARVDAPRSSVFAAIKRLHDTGVLRPLTDRKRDQVWGASLVLDELDDLGHRIERASS